MCLESEILWFLTTCTCGNSLSVSSPRSRYLCFPYRVQYFESYDFWRKSRASVDILLIMLLCNRNPNCILYTYGYYGLYFKLTCWRLWCIYVYKCVIKCFKRIRLRLYVSMVMWTFLYPLGKSSECEAWTRKKKIWSDFDVAAVLCAFRWFIFPKFFGLFGKVYEWFDP